MRKKVLFVIESLSGGGAEKVLTVLLKHIDKTRFDVTLCTVVETGVYMDEVKKYVSCTSILGNPNRKTFLGNAWYRFKYQCVYNWLPLKWVYRLFVPQGNDVEVAFVEGFATKLMAASTNKKAKKLAWVHTDLSKNPWTLSHKVFVNKDEEGSAYLKFDQVIAVSETARLNFIKRYAFNPQKIVRIYNPLDKDDILNKSKEVLDESMCIKNKVRFITIGRLVHQKGYDRLLQVVKRLVTDGFDFELWILGEGEQKASLNKYIKENSLEDRIKLLGFKSNPYKYLKACDCFICSSRSEGFSLVIAEAMILGLPILSTYCSGPNELLDEGKYGLLVENSEDGLYKGIRTILTENLQNTSDLSTLSLLRSASFNLIDIMKTIEQLFQI